MKEEAFDLVLCVDVMEHIEEIAIASFDHPVMLWRRYVDDTFVIMNGSHIQELHQHLNSINPQIHFTIENETDNSIPFLETSVYRKPTH